MFIFRSVFVFIILAVLSECFLDLSKFNLMHYQISFWKRFLLQTYSGTSCTTTCSEVKILFKVCLWAKIFLSIANLTSKCSAQNLG